MQLTSFGRPILSLVDSSSDARNYVPEDYEKTVLQIFKTSTVPEFNAVYDEKIILPLIIGKANHS